MVFKACVRCGGDMYDEDDIDHFDLVCLQCGFRRTLTLPAAAPPPETAPGLCDGCRPNALVCRRSL